MSHFSKNLAGSPFTTPKGRVAFAGGALVATGLIGFFAFLHGKHERKFLLDKTNDTGKIATWESRMIQRNFPSSDPANPATLRAARIEARSTPLQAIKSQHDAHHRTKSQDRAQMMALANGTEAVPSARIFEVPTAQRDGDGEDVYTKKPLWYESGKVGLLKKRSSPGEGGGEGDGVLDDVVRGVEGMAEDVKETVKKTFSK